MRRSIPAAVLAIVSLLGAVGPQVARAELTFAEKAEAGRVIYLNKLAGSPTPKADYRALPAWKQEQVNAYLTPKVYRERSTIRCTGFCPSSTPVDQVVSWEQVALAMSLAATSTTTYCYVQTFVVEGTNIIGNGVFTYTQFQDMCWRNGRFIEADGYDKVDLRQSVFWTSDGPNVLNSGGVGSDYFKTYSTRRLRLCFAGEIGCIMEGNPWIRQAYFTDPLRRSEGDGGPD